MLVFRGVIFISRKEEHQLKQIHVFERNMLWDNDVLSNKVINDEQLLMCYRKFAKDIVIVGLPETSKKN